jgi:hypothetical protein
LEYPELDGRGLFSFQVLRSELEEIRARFKVFKVLGRLKEGRLWKVVSSVSSRAENKMTTHHSNVRESKNLVVKL